MKINNIKIRNSGNRARSSQVFTDRKKQASRKACRKTFNSVTTN